MSETFRLNQVLDHARLKEEAQATELSGLDAEHRRSQSALDQLREKRASQLAALAATNRPGKFDRHAIEVASHYLERLEDSITEQVTHVVAVAARVEESRVALLAIAREKRLLERLEERHDETVAADQMRRENTRSDELSGQRFQRMRQQRPQGEVA